MRVAVRWVQQHVARHTDRDLGYNMAAAAGLAFTGDVICQFVIEKHEQMDWRRALAVVSFSTLYTGGLCHYVYPMYPVWAARMIPRAIGSSTLSNGIGCTVIDNCIHSPFIYLPTFYYWTGTIQGESVKEAHQHLKDDWWIVASTCFYMWVPIQFLNFTVVPPRYRLVFVNVCNLVWNTTLDYLAHRNAAQPVTLRSGEALIKAIEL